MRYQHVGYVERLEIADGRRDGLSLRAIAREPHKTAREGTTHVNAPSLWISAGRAAYHAGAMEVP